MKNLFNIKNHTHKLIVGMVFLSFLKTDAQVNLVPNPSFEQYTHCPTSLIVADLQFYKPDIWYKPDRRYASYINRCANNQPINGVPYNRILGKISYQETKSGDGYMGMFYFNGNGNNYIQVKLKDSLVKNKKYYCEYYVSLSNSCRQGCNNIGMLFTNNAIFVDTLIRDVLIANPQILSYGNPIVTDTMNWVKISGTLIANGGEQYLTLGNFKLETQTLFTNIQPFPAYNGSWYYVDDVAVFAINDSFCLKADAGKDTTIKIGDSVFIGNYTNGIDTIKWYNAAGQVIDSVQPGFWVKPITNTYYTLEQQVNGCVSKDTINVLVQPLPLKFTMFDVRCLNVGCSSSPRGNERSVENKWQTANEINVSHFNIQRSIDGIHFETIGKVVAKNNSLNDYNFIHDKLPNTNDQLMIYFRLQSVDKDGKTNYSDIKKLEIKNQKSEISIYPNPAKDIINIQSKELIKEIKIVNQLGQVIYYKNNSNSTSIKISTKEFAKGLYLVQVNNENIKLLLE